MATAYNKINALIESTRVYHSESEEIPSSFSNPGALLQEALS